MAFQVGVSGHRALPEADLPGLSAAASALFRAVREEVQRLHAADQAAPVPLFQPAAPALRCVCGLAEGADALLAEAALAEGWTLAAPLPFAREEFAQDFAPGPALDRYHALLGQAAAVCELDGDRGQGGTPYADVGHQIVEQSDLLLVIWDGLPPRGPGGTGDVANEATQHGVPVAVLPAAGPVTLAWRGAGGRDVPGLVQAALLPAADAVADVSACLQDAPAGAGWAAAIVRAWERVVLAGTVPTDTALAQGAATPDPTTAAAGSALLPYHRAAARLAAAHAARHEAAGLLRYGLVLLATLGALLGIFGGPWPGRAGAALQVGSLAAVLLFSAGRWCGQAHRRSVAHGALAAFLHGASLLMPLGAVPRLPGNAVPQAAADSWTGWYLRAVLRAAGLPPVRLDGRAVAAAAAALRDEAGRKATAFMGRAERYAAIARRLQWTSIGLAVGGIAAAASRAVLLPPGGGAAAAWLNGLAVMLPVMAAASMGVLSFGDYGRRAGRCRAASAALGVAQASLDGEGTGRPALLRAASRIAWAMQDTAADGLLPAEAPTA